MTERTVTPETLESIEKKLIDVCSILLSAKYVLECCDDGHTATAINVLVSRAGAVVDSAIINDLGVPGCVGDHNAWANHAF